MPFKRFPLQPNIVFSCMISLGPFNKCISSMGMKYVALKKFKRKCKVRSNLNGKPTRNKPSLSHRILPYMCKLPSNIYKSYRFQEIELRFETVVPSLLSFYAKFGALVLFRIPN